jgi:4-hydroxybenzoate polyprenyltransferase
MNKYLKQALDFLLFSNVFIALCAVTQGIISYWLIGIKPDKYVLALLFCSTLATYNFSILLSKPENPEKSHFLRVRWIFSHYKLMISLFIISVLSLIPLAFFLHTSSLILMLSLGLISIAYSLPIFGIPGKKFGLRNIPGLKLFIIGAVWAGSTVLLPIHEIEGNGLLNISNKETILLFFTRFLFIVAITIPFDIRDLFQDQSNALRTIPVIFGEKKSLFLCQLFLATSLILLFVYTEKLDTNFWAISLSIFISGWLILKSRWKKNEYYYFLLLDGTMILQLIILQFFKLIT